MKDDCVQHDFDNVHGWCSGCGIEKDVWLERQRIYPKLPANQRTPDHQRDPPPPANPDWAFLEID